MNEKAQTRLILGMTIAVIMAIGFAIALDFTPKGNVDMQWRYFITNGTKATFNDTVNITSTGRLYANQSWQHFNYPDACTSGYYITKLGDLVTCTTPSFFISNIDMNMYNITNVSRIGIGTSSPSSKFEIAKSAGTNEVNLSGVMYVNSTSGYVGIGTSQPNDKLDIRGNIVTPQGMVQTPYGGIGKQ
jgi:hypothetical protein